MKLNISRLKLDKLDNIANCVLNSKIVNWALKYSSKVFKMWRLMVIDIFAIEIAPKIISNSKFKSLKM